MRVRAATQPTSVRFELVGTLRGFRRWFLSYTFPTRLPDPHHLTVLARPGVVGAACRPHLRSQVRAAPSFSGLLRQAAGGVLSPPHGSKAPRGARRGRTEARCRGFPRSVSSARPPNPACDSSPHRALHELMPLVRVYRPVVQLGLHVEYPGVRLDEAWPRRADIHQRPPRPASCCESRWTPSPCGRLSRPPRQVVTPATTTGPPPHPAGISRQRAFPTGRQAAGRSRGHRVVPTFTLQPFVGVGVQLYPCGLATPTPQPFGVASLPTTLRADAKIATGVSVQPYH